MAVRPILLADNPILRQKSKKVKRIDASIQQLIDDLIDTMRAAPGVGLAAPQIGVLQRVIVVEVDEKLTVLINPELVSASGEWEPEEGCLSLPGYYANVKRAWAVTVRGKDRKGKDVKIKAEGLFAQALQHEIDHLNGILFIDRLESLDQLRRVEPAEAGASSK
ncbi:MAG TPA: peptide deformylase [Chloroflexota bacterium]